ncbi:MAG TPA: hypothetical protein VNT25_03800 [Allosphingosinicella sp.]|nr:hypothetical protein [Allosphingosinicella sp.]
MFPANSRFLCLFASALALALASCASRGSFPSLAPRPAEGLSNEEPVRTPVAVAPDRGLAGTIARLIGQAREGQRAFERALPRAREAASRAGAAGSDSWVEAQQALSRLEAARKDTIAALAELDRLTVERAAVPTNAAQFEALQATAEAVASLARDQQEEVDRLRRLLRPS